jgi:hypothetical protein
VDGSADVTGVAAACTTLIIPGAGAVVLYEVRHVTVEDELC